MLIPFLIYSFSSFVWSIFLYSDFDIQNFLCWIFEKFSISIFFIFCLYFWHHVCVSCMCPWVCVCMQDSVLMCPCSGVSFGGFYLSHFLSTLHIEVEAPKLASEILLNLAIHLIPFNLPGWMVGWHTQLVFKMSALGILILSHRHWSFYLILLHPSAHYLP